MTILRVPNNLLNDKGKLTPQAICAMYLGNERKIQSKNNNDLTIAEFDNICAKAVNSTNSRSPFQCQTGTDWGALGSAKTAVACANTNTTWRPYCNEQINTTKHNNFPWRVDPSGMCVTISGKKGQFTGGYSYDNMPGFQQKDTDYCDNGNAFTDAKVILTGLVNEDPHSKYVDCNYTLKDEDIKNLSSDDMATYSKIYEDQFKVKDERSNGYYIGPADEKKGSWQSGNRQLLSTWCWTRDENNSNPSNQALPRVLTESTICKPLTRNNDLFKNEVASWCEKCNQEIKRFKKQCHDQKIKCTIKGDQCPECDCYNDLKDRDIRKTISEIATNFPNADGGSGDSSCYWNSCADTAKTLQPDMKKKCPNKVPQCTQIIQIVNPVNKLKDKIIENLNCTNKGPGPGPGPTPAPTPGPKLGSMKIAGGGLLVLVALAVLFLILQKKSTDPMSLFGFLGIQNKPDFLMGMIGILVCIAVLIFLKSREY